MCALVCVILVAISSLVLKPQGEGGGGGVGEGALKPPPQHHDYQSISRKVRPSSLQVFQKHLWLILGCYALKDFVVNSIS